jgi:hypothetical protein
MSCRHVFYKILGTKVKKKKKKKKYYLKVRKIFRKGKYIACVMIKTKG